MNTFFRAASAAALLALATATASAGTTVGKLDGISPDSTFENVGTFGGSIALNSGAYGWTELSGTARAFRDAVLINNSALISGNNATGAYAVQFDTDVAIQANTSYTLSVDLGFMTPVATRSAPYSIELGVLSSGGVFTQLAVSNGTALMTQHFGDGASLTVTTAYLSGMAGSGDLAVRLTRLDGGTDGRWLGFDNVVLTAAPVPEPATTALFGLGLTALLLGRRVSRNPR